MNKKPMFPTWLAVILLAVRLAGPAVAAVPAVQDEFGGSSLSPAWTTRDGYALQLPADTANHAAFRMTGSQLSISFQGGQEHNMWWLKHAQVTRAYEGSGTYEIKVDTPFTGAQQFGLVFQKDPGTFMIFMLYATDQIRAYVERFAVVNGQQYKATVAGQTLGLSVPNAGPYYVRVTVDDDPDPSKRSWRFDWSSDGSTWTNIVAGVYETTSASENAGVISQVGIFAGNQPYTFDAFDARFDYFRYYSQTSGVPLPAPANLMARGSDQRVELWWDAVEGADSYGVYRSATAGGPYQLLGVSAERSFNDSAVVNDNKYFYVVAAFRNGSEGQASPELSVVPHVVAGMQDLPQQGLVLALNADDLTHDLADGDPVERWPNAIGPRIGAAALGGRAPRLATTGLNGRSAVRFDGLDDFLTLPRGFQDFTAGMSLYLVVRPTVLQTGFKFVLLGNGANQQNIGLGRAGSTAGYQYFTGNSAGSVAWFNTDARLAAGTPSLVSVLQEGGPANGLSFAEVAHNGEPVLGNNVYVPPITDRGQNYVGKSYWNDGIFQGDIAEILLYNRILTYEERAVVHSYVSQKYSLTISGTSPPPPPPPPPLEAPTGLKATAGDSTVGLSWNAVSGATGYRVFRTENSSGPYVQMADLAVVSFADNAVVNGTTYYYVVRAYDSTQESASSNQVFATPLAPPPPPPPPSAELPTAGLMLALDAGQLAQQLGDGAAVTTWRDASGLGNDAVAGTGAPTLIANAIGGRPAVRFDGVDDFLSLPGGFQNFTAGMSLYVVMRPTVLQKGFKILSLGNGANKQNIGLGRAGSASGLQYFTNNSSNSVTWFNTSNGLTAGEAALFSVIQAAGAANSTSYAEVAKNGVALFGKNMYVPPITTRGTNYIGKSYWNSDGMMQGDVAEVLLYDRILSTSEQSSVRAYIAQKYGLTVQ